MKILLIRFSSIGDIVLTSPIVRCVKKQIPNAEVHYLTKSTFQSLVQNNPHIDNVHVLKESLKETIDCLIEEEFDLVIDLHKNIRTRLIRRKLGVKYFSFKKLNFKKWLFTSLHINKLPKTHLVDRYFNALSDLAIVNDGQGLDAFIAEGTFLPNLPEKPFTVFAIGGTYATKRLPNQMIASIIDKLNQVVVLIGGPSDQENAKRIRELTQNKELIDLCGKLNLDQSALCIKKSSHVICHDSGMMHIASAYHKPMSLIWGNTHSDFGMSPYGYSKKDNLFQYENALKCRPCSKLGYDSCPKKHFKCMKNHNVDEIVKNWRSVEAMQ